MRCKWFFYTYLESKFRTYSSSKRKATASFTLCKLFSDPSKAGVRHVMIPLAAGSHTFKLVVKTRTIVVDFDEDGIVWFLVAV